MPPTNIDVRKIVYGGARRIMGAGGRAATIFVPAIAVTPLASSQQAAEEMWGQFSPSGRGNLARQLRSSSRRSRRG
jgi:hypothetical protein